jgi:hypothetical protein
VPIESYAEFAESQDVRDLDAQRNGTMNRRTLSS